MGETVLLLLVVVLVVVPFLTVWQNRQPVIAGPTFISGLRLYDAFSMSARTLIMIVPFLLAQRFLASADSHRMLLKALVIAAVAYSFLVLFEVRMSPQLNAWIYGFFPHSWTQHLRGGGFRPVVFLPHGLALGLFLASAVVAAAVLWRDALKTRALAMPWHYATVWLALALLLSRNFGAMALAILMASLVLLAPPRWGVWAAGGIAIIVLAYPALRTAGWVPTDIVQGIVSSMDEQRAGSLQFRIENEDILLARANAKPVAGWGSWGRGRVYDEVTGRDVSVTDGLWVIRIGASGWLGYLSMFGLLTLPGVLIWSRLGPEKIDGATVGLMLIMALALLDAIPNAFLGPVHWLIAGALAGRYVQIARELELPSSSGGCS